MVGRKSEFDEYSHNYQSLVNNFLHFSGLTVDFFTQGKADFLNSLLKNKEKHSLLDVGWGVGDLRKFLATQERNILGVDVSSESIKIAKDANPQNTYSVYDGKVLPFADNTFDAVSTVCVMHRVPPIQWQTFIQEMVRAVKKQGLVAIFEHNPFNPLTRVAVNRCPFDKEAVLLKAKQVERMLLLTGQIIPISHYIFFTPFKNNFFRKLDGFLSWLTLGAQYLYIRLETVVL